MSEKENILTRDIVLEPLKVANSGLTSKKAEFLLNVLEETFGEVMMPKDDELADISKIHPIVWMLIDYSGKYLRKLFQLCLEISIVKNIPNHETVLKKITTANGFVGARAEIYFGSQLRTATNDIQFIPESKGIKTPDLEIKTANQYLYIEVKGSDATDFEVGIDMFEGWIRSRLKEIFPKDHLQRVVRFDASWIGAIAAACNIKIKIKNASWAFHSTIMSLVDEAALIIRNYLSQDPSKSRENELGIEIVSFEKTKNNELSIVVELPQAKRVASIGNIIQKLTNQEYIEKFNNGNGVFAFFTRYAVNKIVATKLLNTLLIQCPELRYALLGLAIFNDEDASPIFIHSPESYPDELWFPNYFKEPIWNEKLGCAIIP